jgi:hypothetical protein
MNKEWSTLNKTMQLQLKKKETFADGIQTLFALRKTLIETLLNLKTDLSRKDFDAIPFINADGFHNKTIAYSIWHIFRIEDIVAHTLICDDQEVFFAGNYKERINSPIITTGNELVKQEIADFSAKLNLEELYSYAQEVKKSTEKILESLSFDDLKKKIPAERKIKLENLNVVSSNERAIWLIDYWCGKDIRGLIQMPFSRHWIMHIEASLRIKEKIHLAQN